MVIIYEMGAAPMMSTPAASYRMHRLPLFSGKLSGVTPTSEDSVPGAPPAEAPQAAPAKPPHEIGGREGADPTRFGDWELRGRCIDF
jgi:hypothetical protein